MFPLLPEAQHALQRVTQVSRWPTLKVIACTSKHHHNDVELLSKWFLTLSLAGMAYPDKATTTHTYSARSTSTVMPVFS